MKCEVLGIVSHANTDKGLNDKQSFHSLIKLMCSVHTLGIDDLYDCLEIDQIQWCIWPYSLEIYLRFALIGCPFQKLYSWLVDSHVGYFYSLIQM